MEAVSQSLQGGPGGLGGGLRVDLHGHRDLRVAQDLHDLARVDIEIDQQGGTGTPTVMDGDLPDPGLAAASIPGPVEIARLDGVLPTRRRSGSNYIGFVIGSSPSISGLGIEVEGRYS